MKKYLVKTPKYVQRIFAKRTWAFLPNGNQVYLTFDDGPIPEVTPWVLDLLNKHEAKATFFCIGDNVRKHSEVFKRIASEGHAVGNHTMHHLNGWRTTTEAYLEDVGEADKEFKNWLEAPSAESVGTIKSLRKSSFVNRPSLFRPPYGKLSSKQAQKLQKKGYHIIMWDVLSADFDTSISEEKCLQNVIRHLKPGSIVVFHDSLKAEKRLNYVLPKVLKHITEKGWKPEAISRRTLAQDQ